MPKNMSIPEELKMNFDQIIGKPFIVTTLNWGTSSVGGTEFFRLPYPTCLLSNPLMKVPFNSSAYYQTKMCAMLQVSGTPMHQGTMLVAAIPHYAPMVVDMNQILSAPHVFLNANESTSVCLEIPMYINSTLQKTQDPSLSIGNSGFPYNPYGRDFCDLVFFTVNTLAFSSGSSTSLSISVHNIFKEAHFYVPKVGIMEWQAQCGSSLISSCFGGCRVSYSKTRETTVVTKRIEKTIKVKPVIFKPEALEDLLSVPTKIIDSAASGLKSVAGDIIDIARSAIRTLTGFHNPNVSVIDKRTIVGSRNFQNNVDIKTHMEVMDNHALFNRVYDDYYFRTDQDEMDLKYLLQKKVYLGTFKVDSNTVVGKNLFAYPITPMVESRITDGAAKLNYYSPMRTLYECSRFWRGSLKLHIQAVCTNFHYTKIVVLKTYDMQSTMISPSSAQVPAYSDIHNMCTDTLEFSAGGQIQTIDLPFCSSTRQLECTKDFIANAIMHGMIYAYLVQPLTHNSNVPTSVSFNVYMSGGDDLEFSGYATDQITTPVATPPTYPAIPGFFGPQPGLVDGGFNEDLSARGLLTHRPWSSNLISKRPSQENKPSKLSVQQVVTKQELARTRRAFKQVKHDPKPSVWKKESDEQYTTVEASGQTDILVHKSEQADTTRLAFRPNKSIREYVRFMYPSTTHSVSPDTDDQLAVLNLSAMLYSGDGFIGTALAPLVSLYYGLSGSLKLKIFIVGASAASVRYVPPSVYAINGDYNRFYPTSNTVPTDIGVRNMWVDGSVLTASKPFTTPVVEIQEVTRPFTNAPADLASAPGHILEYEICIPNMNFLNFVGSASNYYAVDDVSNNLGNVIIAMKSSHDGDGLHQDISVQAFAGLTDESRLGFQCFCPEKTIPTVVSTSPTRRVRSSPYITEIVTSVMPAAIPVTGLGPSSSYYFN